MSVIVTDSGFSADDWTNGFCDARVVANDICALDLPSSADPGEITLSPSLKMIRVDFPSSGDGRGFTIARQLRLRGFTGRLRARGHVISDQYAMARRAGFDEVEISDDLAARQSQAEWLYRANWQENDYQSRLRG